MGCVTQGAEGKTGLSVFSLGAPCCGEFVIWVTFLLHAPRGFFPQLGDGCNVNELSMYESSLLVVFGQARFWSVSDVGGFFYTVRCGAVRVHDNFE